VAIDHNIFKFIKKFEFRYSNFGF